MVKALSIGLGGYSFSLPVANNSYAPTAATPLPEQFPTSLGF
jgi:hypothetical protein